MALFDQLTDQQRIDLLIAADFAEEANLEDVCELLRSVASTHWRPLLPLNKVEGSPVAVRVDGSKRAVSLYRQDSDRLVLLSYPGGGQTLGLFSKPESEVLLKALGKLDSDFEVIETVRWLYQARLNLTLDRVLLVSSNQVPLGTFETTAIREEPIGSEYFKVDSIELRRCDPGT